MNTDFRLLMIGAMYENGGNTTHRFLDGHPELLVYPFESQLGTRLVVDRMSSLFPVKYRWPVFALDASPEGDYRAIIDEECKVRARTPNVSKFRDWPFDFDDDERLEHYVRYARASGRSRGANIEAFFRATFDAWKDVRRTGEEKVYVGYSPALDGRRGPRSRRPSRRTFSPRRSQPVVRLRRHEEAPCAASARRLHALLDAEPVLRDAVCRPASGSVPHRAHRGPDGGSGRDSEQGPGQARAQLLRNARDSELERDGTARGVSVGNDPHRHDRRESCDCGRAVARGMRCGRRASSAVHRQVRLRRPRPARRSLR